MNVLTRAEWLEHAVYFGWQDLEHITDLCGLHPEVLKPFLRCDKCGYIALNDELFGNPALEAVDIDKVEFFAKPTDAVCFACRVDAAKQKPQ
jgi:hypothetical protein